MVETVGILATTPGDTISLDWLHRTIMQATHKIVRADLVVTTRDLWGKIHDRLQPSQRFPHTDQGARLVRDGFDALSYWDAHIVYDEGIPTGELYVLDTNTANEWKDVPFTQILRWVKAPLLFEWACYGR